MFTKKRRRTKQRQRIKQTTTYGWVHNYVSTLPPPSSPILCSSLKAFSILTLPTKRPKKKNNNNIWTYVERTRGQQTKNKVLGHTEHKTQVASQNKMRGIRPNRGGHNNPVQEGNKKNKRYTVHCVYPD